MPRAKIKKRARGRRVNVWIPNHQLKLWDSLENGSKFLQIALDDAIGIMTWNLMKERDPYYKNIPEKHKLEDVIGPFNEKFPLDPLTKARLNKKENESWPNSAPKQELW